MWNEYSVGTFQEIYEQDTVDKQENYYLLTPWSRVLLEKLNGSQPLKKFPSFYGA